MVQWFSGGLAWCFVMRICRVVIIAFGEFWDFQPPLSHWLTSGIQHLHHHYGGISCSQNLQFRHWFMGTVLTVITRKLSPCPPKKCTCVFFIVSSHPFTSFLLSKKKKITSQILDANLHVNMPMFTIKASLSGLENVCQLHFLQRKNHLPNVNQHHQ